MGADGWHVGADGWHAGTGVKALRFIDRRFQLVDVPPPVGDGGKTLVRVRSAAICSSDLGMAAAGLLDPEVTVGHEIAGMTTDGAAVAVEPVGVCGELCEWCAAGRYNVCGRATRRILGFGLDGGMAETVAVNPSSLVRLPAGVSPDDACLIEPLAVCVHAFRRIEMRTGNRLLIVGGGALGLAAAAVAGHWGAQVSVMARHDAQKAAAERLGATVLESESRAGRFDVSVLAAGTDSAASEAVRRVQRNGAVLLLASFFGKGLTLPGIEFTLKELRLVSSTMYGRGTQGRDIDAAAKLLAEIPELPAAMVSHRFPLDAGEEAFAAAKDRSGGAIKVVIEPEAG